MFANDLYKVPDDAREQMQEWMRGHHIDPDTCAGMTIDYDLMGIWHKHYERSGTGLLVIGADFEPKTYEEWTKLDPGEDKPPWLIWMHPFGQKAPGPTD